MLTHCKMPMYPNFTKTAMKTSEKKNIGGSCALVVPKLRKQPSWWPFPFHHHFPFPSACYTIQDLYYVYPLPFSRSHNSSSPSLGYAMLPLRFAQLRRVLSGRRPRLDSSLNSSAFKGALTQKFCTLFFFFLLLQ